MVYFPLLSATAGPFESISVVYQPDPYGTATASVVSDGSVFFTNFSEALDKNGFADLEVSIVGNMVTGFRVAPVKVEPLVYEGDPSEPGTEPVAALTPTDPESTKITKDESTEKVDPEAEKKE